MLHLPGLITPYRGSSRPPWPFAINKRSPQFYKLRGLFAFAPPLGIDSDLIDVFDFIEDPASSARQAWSVTDPDNSQDYFKGDISGMVGHEGDGVNDSGNLPANWALSNQTITKWSVVILFRQPTSPTLETDLYHEFSAISDWTLRVKLNDAGVGGDIQVTINDDGFTNLLDLDWAGGINDGEIHQIIVTKDGADYVLFGDGVQRDSGSVTLSVGAKPTFCFVPGFVDEPTVVYLEVRQYKEPLEIEMVKHLFDIRTRWDLYLPVSGAHYPAFLDAAPNLTPPTAAGVLTGTTGGVSQGRPLTVPSMVRL